MRRHMLVALFWAALTFGADAEDVSLPPGWMQHGEIWSVTGTVRYLNIEGGCWAIDIGSRKLQPVSLPDNFKVDGLAVSASVRAENDMTTICAFGQIVTVLGIQKR